MNDHSYGQLTILYAFENLFQDLIDVAYNEDLHPVHYNWTQTFPENHAELCQEQSVHLLRN